MFPTADRWVDTKVKCPTGRASFWVKFPTVRNLMRVKCPGIARTEIIDLINIFKSSQSIAQYKAINSQHVLWCSWLWCLFINCQAQTVRNFVIENIVLLYFRFYIYYCDKLIRLTIFHHEYMASQNIIFTVICFKIVEWYILTPFTKYILLQLSLCLVIVNAADHEVLRNKLSHSLSQQVYISEFEHPFWVVSVLKEHLHPKFKWLDFKMLESKLF